MTDEFPRPAAADAFPYGAPTGPARVDMFAAPDAQQVVQPDVAVAASAPPDTALPTLAPYVQGAAQRQRRGGLGGGNMITMLAAGLLALLIAGGLAIGTGVVDVTGGGSELPEGQGRSAGTSSYSYYHESSYDPGTSGDERWSTEDRRRAQDPNEAVLGSTSRWEYDGPYEYGPYGSEGMKQRQRGVGVDPLASNVDPLPDVFDSQGPTDPSGGQPVGAPPSSWTNPYYDAYAPGYSNPYANRIRMTWGEGYGAGQATELGP